MEKIARAAGGDSHAFGEMVDWAKQLPCRPPPVPPIPAPPPEVAFYGFTGVDFKHSIEGRSWEYLNNFKRQGKDTTLIAQGTSPSQISI